MNTEHICSLSKDYGLLCKNEKNEDVLAPIALHSTPFPKLFYEKSLSLQSIWNALMARLCEAREFVDDMLSRQLSGMLVFCVLHRRGVFRLDGSDDFCLKLYSIELDRRSKNMEKPN